LQLDRLDRRRVGRPEQEGHRADRRGTSEEADREQGDDPPPQCGASREFTLMIVAVHAGHAGTKVSARGEPAMSFT
jgi:hypothetical protein